MPNTKSNFPVSVIKLSVLSPDLAPVNAEALSVRLTLADSAVSGSGGGQYGIRPGHADAVMLLSQDGALSCVSSDPSAPALKLRISGGFARVGTLSDSVTGERYTEVMIVTEKAEII